MPGSTFRQCPHCTEKINCANRRCTKCGKLLALKARQTARMGKFRACANEWAKKMKKSRNQSKVFDNSALLLEKLKALGFAPLLMLGKYKPGDQKWTAQLQFPFDVPVSVHAIFEKIILLFEGLLEAWNPEREQRQERTEENNQAVAGGEEEAEEEKEEENEQEDREHRMELVREPEVPGQREGGESEAGEMEEVEAGKAFQEAIRQIEEGLLDTEQNMEQKARECTEETEAKKVVDKGQEEGVMSKSDVKITGKKRGKGRRRKDEDCSYHNDLEVFPVQFVSKHRERKGQKEVLVNWLPCPACKKVWPPSWEPQQNISLDLTTNTTL